MQPITDGVLSPWEPGVFSLTIFVFMVIVFIGLMVFMAAWLGEKKRTPEKARPYECGIIPSGSARFRYPVPFYLVAIFFLIFDIEGAFVFTWAVVYEDIGWPGYIQMSFFIILLLLGLFYIWKQGGLDWRVAYREIQTAGS